MSRSIQPAQQNRTEAHLRIAFIHRPHPSGSQAKISLIKMRSFFHFSSPFPGTRRTRYWPPNSRSGMVPAGYDPAACRAGWARDRDRPHRHGIGVGHDLAAQPMAAVRIGQGERITAGAVPGQEPALEVGAPGLIRLCDLRKWPALGRSPWALLARLAEPSRRSRSATVLPAGQFPSG